MRTYNRLVKIGVIRLLLLNLVIISGMTYWNKTPEFRTSLNGLNHVDSTEVSLNAQSMNNRVPKFNVDSSLLDTSSPNIKKQALPQYSLEQLPDYYQTIVWNNTNIVINSTTILPYKSHVIIDSCNVSFFPNNTDIYLEIGPVSLIEISNSHFFKDLNSNGSCRFLTGGICEVIISDSIFESCNINLYLYSTIEISNSVFLNLGERGSKGFAISDSSVTIDHSQFINCVQGLYFTDCAPVTIAYSFFENNEDNGIIGERSNTITIANTTFRSHLGSSIMLRYCYVIEIQYCQFYDNKLLIELESSWWLFVRENIFRNFGLGIRISSAPGEFGTYGEAWITENEFINGTGNGILIDGSKIPPNAPGFATGSITYVNVICTGNNLTNIANTGIEFYGWNLVAENNIITNVRTGIRCGKVVGSTFYPGTNITLSNNRISYFRDFGVRLEDNWIVAFNITSNNISHSNGIGISFHGQVGGTNQRAKLVGNIINDTKIAIKGTTARRPFNVYQGRLTDVDIYRNVFLNCDNFTQFDTFMYPITNVVWSSDFWGNYWDGYNDPDEDNNFIGDHFFVLSTQFGFIDKSPLLSLDMLSKELASTHPNDKTALHSELPIGLEWTITPTINTMIEVFINGTQVNHMYKNSIVNITFSNSSQGFYNVTISLRSLTDNSTYLDTVWLEIKRDGALETNELLLSFLTIIAITGVSFSIAIWFLHPRIKKRLNRIDDAESMDESIINSLGKNSS